MFEKKVDLKIHRATLWKIEIPDTPLAENDQLIECLKSPCQFGANNLNQRAQFHSICAPYI